MSVPRTFSDANIQGYRDWHAKANGYGRHQHVYLHATMRELADEIAQKNHAPPSLLDYGCGKGAFLEEMRQRNLFAEALGYDPAVDAYRTRPRGSYNIVTCLDLIDIVETRFVDAVLEDVARLCTDIVIFDVLCRPPRESGFKAHPPFYWSFVVARRLSVLSTTTEFPGMDGFERAIIKAAPL